MNPPNGPKSWIYAKQLEVFFYIHLWEQKNGRNGFKRNEKRNGSAQGVAGKDRHTEVENGVATFCLPKL